MDSDRPFWSGAGDGLGRAAYFAFLASIFAAPFTLPGGRLLLAVCFVLMLAGLVRGRRLPGLPMVGWLALAFIVLACIVTVNGVNPELGCRKLRKLVWFIGIPVAALLVNDAGRLRSAMTALAAGTVVLSLDICISNPVRAVSAVHAGEFATFSAALINEGSMTDGQRLVVGLLATLGLLFSVNQAKALHAQQCGTSSRAGKCGAVLRAVERLPAPVLLTTALLIQTAAFIMNFKRGSWIVALLAVAVFVAVRVNWKSLVVLGLIALLSVAIPPVRARLSGLQDEFSPRHGGRMTMWCKVTPALIDRYPWGVGYRSLTNEMMREIAPEVERDRDHLHSNIAQVLVATGWLGLALYLAWMARAIMDGWSFARRADEYLFGQKTMATALLLMLLALLMNGLIEYNFGDAELVLLYGCIMGCCAAGCRRVS